MLSACNVGVAQHSLKRQTKMCLEEDALSFSLYLEPSILIE